MTILDRIVHAKRHEVERLRSRRAALEARAGAAPAPRDFARALDRDGEVALIAEVKRRSPGAGAIREDLEPVALAGAYAGGGAAALSVLTDGPFFGGSLEDLVAVRAAVSLPLLRKDFTIDPLQVLEGRAAGADAVLLIVGILDDARLGELADLADGLGMAALVEVHDGVELERALAAGARIVGINNRDLRTFDTRLEVTLDLIDRVPDDVFVVSESGVRTPEDVDRVGAAGARAVLVGETLLRAADPGAEARRLSRRPRVAGHGGPRP